MHVWITWIPTVCCMPGCTKALTARKTYVYLMYCQSFCFLSYIALWLLSHHAQIGFALLFTINSWMAPFICLITRVTWLEKNGRPLNEVIGVSWKLNVTFLSKNADPHFHWLIIYSGLYSFCRRRRPREDAELLGPPVIMLWIGPQVPLEGFPSLPWQLAGRAGEAASSEMRSLDKLSFVIYNGQSGDIKHLACFPFSAFTLGRDPVS